MRSPRFEELDRQIAKRVGEVTTLQIAHERATSAVAGRACFMCGKKRMCVHRENGHIEAVTQIKLRELKASGPARIPLMTRPAREIILRAAINHKIDFEDVLGKTRLATLVSARREAASRMAKELGYTLTMIGKILDCHYSTVASLLEGAGVRTVISAQRLRDVSLEKFYDPPWEKGGFC